MPRSWPPIRRRKRHPYLEEDVRVPSPGRLRRPRRAAGGEALAIMLRPGNAGSNTAAEHIEVTRLALAQLPRRLHRRALIRTDSGGGTHDFLTWLSRPSRRLRYSVGMTISEEMQEA